MDSDNYVLRGGQAGAARLRLLNQAKWPTTEQLLDTAGLRSGMRVLDVGCGGGDMTLKMAAIAGAGGEAVGVDFDPEILHLARREAEALGLPVTFRHLDAEELEAESDYDFVFARYLLSHVSRPERTVEAMMRAIRPGGLMAVEDVYFPGHICYPSNDAFMRYVELYQAASRRKGGNPEIGPRLLEMALDAGLSDAEVGIVVPTFRRGDGKRVAQVTMEHIREAVVDAGLATNNEVDGIITDLSAFADDERTLMSLTPTFQVWGRKGSG